jgi:hypothetical protein
MKNQKVLIEKRPNKPIEKIMKTSMKIEKNLMTITKKGMKLKIRISRKKWCPTCPLMTIPMMMKENRNSIYEILFVFD